MFFYEIVVDGYIMQTCAGEYFKDNSCEGGFLTSLSKPEELVLSNIK